MMDTKLLTLIRASETGSYTRAAEQLSLTQPAVSQHIKQLETEYGVRLFDRSHNKLRLTSEGEVMVKYARRIQAMYSRMEQSLKNEPRQVRSLTIGITHSAESSTIIEALAEYMRQYDNLNLKIITNTTDNLYAMLGNYELDMAFMEGRTTDSAMNSMMLDTDCLILAVPPEHPLADRGVITVEQLKQEKLILRLPSSNTRKLFTASLESQNLRIQDFNVIMEIDSVATIKDLIRHGFGVSVLARSACLDEMRRGKLAALSVENLSMTREINIVFPMDFEFPELVKGIVETYNEMQRK